MRPIVCVNSFLLGTHATVRRRAVELGMYLAFLVGGLVVGGAVTWAWFRSSVVRLRSDLGAAQEAEKVRAGELVEARKDSDSWRDKHQAEQLERAKFEVEARRVNGLEARVTVLSEEIAELSAVKAQLQTRIEEQGRAHLEKVAAL